MPGDNYSATISTSAQRTKRRNLRPCGRCTKRYARAHGETRAEKPATEACAAAVDFLDAAPGL